MTYRTLCQLIVWATAGSLLVWYAPGCAPFEDLDRTDGALPTAARCGQCHSSVYEEWRRSPHSMAFTSQEFLARTDGGTMERCVTCHAPAPSLAELARPPTARLDAREEGVTCISCHRIAPDHGSPASPSMAGPLAQDALVQPHAIENLESWFHDAALCGRCHEDSYAEWKTASREDTPTCQGCHMPTVVRKVTQATGLVSEMLVAFEEELELRAHEFSAVAALDETTKLLGEDLLKLHASREDGELILRLENTLPHSIPTGGFGRHRMVVAVTRQEAVISERVLRSQGGAVAPGDVLELRVPDAATGGKVRIEVSRRSPRSDGTQEEQLVWSREVDAGDLSDPAKPSLVAKESPGEVPP